MPRTAPGIVRQGIAERVCTLRGQRGCSVISHVGTVVSTKMSDRTSLTSLGSESSRISGGAGRRLRWRMSPDMVLRVRGGLAA